ncbi:MAG: hypothetical protein PUF65_06275 [Lachnospiraceae bacterium]|nr:hypothetical protein [Lachnospiraceae bacterium]
MTKLGNHKTKEMPYESGEQDLEENTEDGKTTILPKQVALAR